MSGCGLSRLTRVFNEILYGLITFLIIIRAAPLVLWFANLGR